MTLWPHDVSLELWRDSDICGNSNLDLAHVERTTAKSRTGYLIMFSGCPLSWGSKMQTLTGLSTTEVKFIALSEGLCTAIPIMNLIENLRENTMGCPNKVLG